MVADFIIYEGEDWPQTFQYVDNATPPVGIDISSATEILFVATSGATTITKSLSVSGITLVDSGTTGKFAVAIDDDDTTGGGAKTFNYEIKLTLDGVARVIYPNPNVAATFDVVDSLTDGVTP